MPDQKWIDAKNEIAAFKQYVTAKGLPADTPRSYLLPKEEIERLLAQKSGSLDGIRIYVGLKTVNNVVVPTITVVGAEKDAVTPGKYNDFNIPVFTAANSVAARTTSLVAASSSVAGNEDLPPDDGGDDTPGDTIDDGMADPRPCPNTCSDENGLNS